MAETVFSVLRKKLNEDIQSLEQLLRDNRVKDMEHYRYVTGQLRGLTVAFDYVKDLESNYLDEE